MNPDDLAGNKDVWINMALLCIYVYLPRSKSLKFQDLFHVMRMNLTKSDVCKGSLFWSFECYTCSIIIYLDANCLLYIIYTIYTKFGPVKWNSLKRSFISALQTRFKEACLF